MPRFALGHGGHYTVTGETVVSDELAGQITGAIGALLVVALVVMAIVLLLVFGRRRGAAGSVWLRLLPLAVALAAVGITFGLLAVVGARLTIAAVAVLPILVGLAVDYAVQFQARVAEAELSAPGRGRAAVTIAAARGGADARDSGAGDGGRVPGAGAVTGADGAGVSECCWWSGSRSRSPVR